MDTEEQRYRERLGDVSQGVLDIRLSHEGDVVRVGDIVELAIKEAAQKAFDAGMSGSWGDNGAGAFIGHVRAWLDGLENRIPAALDDVMHEHLKEQNPEEYAEFQRLKEKYES